MLQPSVVGHELEGLVVQHVCHHVLQEAGVVRHADDSYIRQSREVVGEPLDRVDVEVVRRLIEQQYLCFVRMVEVRVSTFE